jgi:hypothetical protein
MQMTKGVLLFALNNSEIDYITLAKYSSKKIKKFLNVPVALVTDSESLISYVDLSDFDYIIEVDPQTKYYNRKFKDGISHSSITEWKNTHRFSSFELTPFDETLVMDVDYIINSDILNYCWDQPHDFLIYKNSKDLAGWRSNEEFTKLSDYSIPFYWATVFFFRKTRETSHFFSLIAHIKDNWQYYKFLYQISSANFRNDYAFSIAIHMMNGFMSGNFAKEIPGKMYYTLDKDYFLKIKNDSFYFLAQKNSDIYYPLKVSNLDVHIMNKYSLLRIINE